jgi:hypothetical protein
VNLSITTLVGIAKVAVVFVCLTLYFFDRLTLEQLVPTVIGLQGALSGVGFIAAADNKVQKDGETK